MTSPDHFHRQSTKPLHGRRLTFQEDFELCLPEQYRDSGKVSPWVKKVVS